MTYDEDIQPFSQDELKRLSVDEERLSDEDAQIVAILLALEKLGGRVTPTPVATVHAALIEARQEVQAYRPRRAPKRPAPPRQPPKPATDAFFKG